MATKSTADSQPVSGFLLGICGLYVMCLGFLLAVTATFTYINPSQVLHVLLGGFDEGPLDGWSWAQTAVAFGMHSYADLYSGITMLATAFKRNKSLPRQVAFWNTTRFVISLLWVLKFIEGSIQFNKQNNKKNIFEFTNLASQLFALFLALDACVIRPMAIYIQRQLADRYPPKPLEELDDYLSLSSLQKFCRAFFYYEAVLSGITGAIYFMFPHLFYWLYGFPESSASFVTYWCMSQFGVLVMSFGLYQMQAEIDQNVGMVLVWLLLDFVWLYYFWDGVGSQIGQWNPMLFQGANMWCHSAFHADSTLALMRTVYLITLLFPSSNKKIKKD